MSRILIDSMGDSSMQVHYILKSSLGLVVSDCKHFCQSHLHYLVISGILLNGVKWKKLGTVCQQKPFQLGGISGHLEVA